MEPYLIASTFNKAFRHINRLANGINLFSDKKQNFYDHSI